MSSSLLALPQQSVPQLSADRQQFPNPVYVNAGVPQLLGEKRSEASTKSGSHICSNCGKIFMYPKDLKRHAKIHERTTIHCPFCSRVYTRKDNLARHIRDQHETLTPPSPEASEPVTVTTESHISGSTYDNSKRLPVDPIITGSPLVPNPLSMVQASTLPPALIMGELNIGVSVPPRKRGRPSKAEFEARRLRDSSLLFFSGMQQTAKNNVRSTIRATQDSITLPQAQDRVLRNEGLPRSPHNLTDSDSDSPHERRGRLSIDFRNTLTPLSFPESRTEVASSSLQASSNIQNHATMWNRLEKGQFRIFVFESLEANHLEDTIFGELQTWDGKKAYEAISHRWGDGWKDGYQFMVNVDGQLHRAPIPRNLYEALQEFGQKDKKCVVWADSLCINMRDDHERSSQIQMMAEIFFRASHVRIWLDGLNEITSKGFRSLRETANLDMRQLESFGNAPENWSMILALLKHDLFTRRWIVQEIAMARHATIHFSGGEYVDFAIFSDLVSLLKEFRPGIRRHNQVVADALDLVPSLNFVIGVNNIVRRTEDGGHVEKLLSLESLVYLLQSFTCSDPSDTIYSLLSLAKDVETPLNIIQQHIHQFSRNKSNKTQHLAVSEELRESTTLPMNPSHPIRGQLLHKSQELAVDYQKPFSEVAVGFVLFALGRSNSLDIICRPWAPHTYSELPSWIPTLEHAAFQPQKGMQNRINADPLVGLPGESSYNAASSTVAVYEFLGHHSLQVQGFRIDVLSETRTEAMAGIIPFKWFKFGGWTDFSKPPPDSLWRTLVADRGTDQKSPPFWFARALHSLAQKLPYGLPLNTEHMLQAEESLAVTRFLQRLQQVTWNRQLIRTSRGRLGLAPESAQPGDLVVILYGCSVPVCLRMMPFSDNAQYKLVGECYVDCVMDGEAVDIKLDEDIQDVEFILV
jgi:Heterokaryon incompatibility protein (HET)/Zinc finger, C2H2 type